MLSHAFEDGVLVVTLHSTGGTGRRGGLSQEIGDLVHAYRPGVVVIVLDEPADGSAIVDAVLEAHRLCDRLGIMMSVATHSAPLRRLLEANADTGGTRLVVHARTDTAILSAVAAAA